MRYIKIILFCLALFLTSPEKSFGNELSELSDLKAQILSIQKENESLRDQFKNQSDTINQQTILINNLIEKVQVLENKNEKFFEDVEQIKAGRFETSYTEEPTGDEREAPSLIIKGFSDVSYLVEEEVNAPDANNNTFALGQLDLFVTSKITDQVSALSEIVFEFGEDNEAILDVERVVLKYSYSDLFNVEIGRMHTALGFWNEAYHHSRWLHTTAFRPLIYNWEDEGGILPVHQVGVQLLGKKSFEAFDVRYNLAVHNGRGETRTKIQNVQDGNAHKAINLQIGIRPNQISGLEVGGIVYNDKIPADLTVAARSGAIDEMIVGGYGVYLKGNLEIFAEGVYLTHDDEVSAEDFGTFGFYVQGGYQFKNWKPYYRFDAINFGEGDPFYSNEAVDITKHTTGIRWDPFSWNSIKLEYGFNIRENEDDSHMLTLQSAYAF